MKIKMTIMAIAMTLLSVQQINAQITYQSGVPTEITMKNPTSSSNSYIHIGLDRVNGRAAGGISIGSRTNLLERFWIFHGYYDNNVLTRKLHINYGGTKHFTMDHQGNIGIGTETPLSKLAVNGQIRATEVRVKANINVPDYVFDPGYNLPSLEETAAYIRANRHLPEIPSAAEVEENGLNLGEMNLRLLKKIEELTLHTINQDQEIKDLSGELKVMKAQMARLLEKQAAQDADTGEKEQ